MIVVLTTVPDIEEAESLAQKIIEAKLAACVQILPPITSFYFWEGAIQKDSEYLLLIKTLAEKFPALENFIRENHSYEIPEIVALASEKVSQTYLGWVEDCVKVKK